VSYISYHCLNRDLKYNVYCAFAQHFHTPPFVGQQFILSIHLVYCIICVRFVLAVDWHSLWQHV